MKIAKLGTVGVLDAMAGSKFSPKTCCTIIETTVIPSN